MVDVPALIAKIHARPEIWDKKHLGQVQKNRTTVERRWMEIAQEMGIDEGPLRRKWKYLRDQFAAEYGKEKLDRTRSKWAYLKSLMFLRNIVAPRPPHRTSYYTRRAVGDVDDDDIDRDPLTDAEGEDAIPVKHESGSGSSAGPGRRSHLQESRSVFPQVSDVRSLRADPPSSAATGAVVSTSQRRRTEARYSSVQASPMELQGPENLEQVVDSRHNENVLFFRSLLPHVDKIPDHQVLRFRARVQEVVQEFAYPAPAPPSRDQAVAQQPRNVYAYSSSPLSERSAPSVTAADVCEEYFASEPACEQVTNNGDHQVGDA